METIIKVIELLLSPTQEWLDVTKDVVVDSDSYYRGFFETTITSRVAPSGGFECDLINDATNQAGLEGYYTPGHPNCLAGFGTGNKIRVRYYYDGEWRTDYKGTIPRNGVIPNTNEFEPAVTHVLAYDWMYVLLNASVKMAEVLENASLGDLMLAVLSKMGSQPDAVVITGLSETFPSCFDSPDESVTALSEANKGARSEMGYIYLVNGRDDQDETLVVEGRLARTAAFPKTQMPQHSRNLSRLVDENGDYPCDEEGNWILGAESIDVSIIPNVLESENAVSPDYVNRVIGKSHPKVVGVTEEVLFTLDSAITIIAGATVPFRISWKDPDNLASSICAKSVLDPEVGVDVLLNSASDGSGTDLSSNLTLTFAADTKGGDVTIKNNGSEDAFLWKLTVYGLAVKSYNTIEFEADAPDVDFEQEEVQSITLDQDYISDTTKTQNFVSLAVIRLSQPDKLVLRWFKICANDSVANAGMLMQWDIGDRIHWSSVRSGIDEDYTIHGIRVEHNGELIIRQFYVKQFILDAYQFWQLGVPGRSELGITCILGFDS